MAFNFKDVDFNTQKITATIVDNSTTGFLWIAFEKNGNNVCKLLKASVHDLKQIYYSIDLSVDRINSLTILSNQIFLSLNDTNRMGKRYNLFTPISNNADIDRPVSVIENPIGLVYSGFYLFYLFPGSESGEFTTIVKINQVGVVQETLVLDESGKEITNGSTITSDGTDLWICTSENPARLIRITGTNTGPMTYEVHTLTV